ncbi:hypothetical protein AQPE_3010 [Aquipluma nitroreducens]|uniref:PNPLA domain-containing protein n=1 Tax=Aquipluma nitroreducens TaxID=2010828 RepID=A0A5K7SBA0_9BACT|nr:patatin-like phospholipase family protein [Aquipluma nitroreducens]BBE18840.1 hypothetical protein AQPE_3010 [Aquipluma nitroreducens]
MTDQKTFRIGLSMAGAVSAGAYTAGVMDYLLEALENWQKAKDLNLPGVPRHNVLVEVLSGASAGGMTAVITAAAVQKDFPHVNQQNYLSGVNKENPLFDSWVNLTEDEKNDMMNQMLSNDDIVGSESINPDKEVRSIFNSLFIEKIARRTLDSIVKDPKTKRSYIADNLELFTTITNLRGFNYELQFITALGPRQDRMTMHKDLVHFQLNPLGTYNNDGKIPIHFLTPEGLNRQLLIDAAISTGAFPVGLSPRVLVREAKYINDNPLLKINHSKSNLVDPTKDYNTVCVDGGVINNEPYDLTETLLMNRRKAEIEKEKDSATATAYKPATNVSDFDTTILMIDPFPNYDESPADYFNLQAIKFASTQLLGAMRQQLMVKSDLLEKAYDDYDYSRFMIAPIRTSGGVTQKESIACGALGGFGGFFNRDFRVHDFMLGRRNCQRFIQCYFSVPESAKNPIIQHGYGDLDKDSLQFFMPEKTDLLPIIPDIRISDDQTQIIKPALEDEFRYPSISLKYLIGLEDKLQARFETVINNITKGNVPGGAGKSVNPIIQRIRRKSWFARNISGPVVGFTVDKVISIGKKAGKNMAAEKFIDSVIADMDKRGLLKQDC